MRVLVLTTLYPNSIMPHHGVFVENRMRAYRDISDTELRVVAPVPFFPFQHSAFGQWATWAKVPHFEERHDIPVYHPRYFIPPKIGMGYAPIALKKAFSKMINQFQSEGWDFDLIDAHYFYPDGIAAVKLANQLGRPVTVTARGTDINLIPKYPAQKNMIINAIAKSDASITVADALKNEMIRLGANCEKITTLRNGVNLDLFRPLDRNKIRDTLNLSGLILASVGHLIERKGHHLVIEALTHLPENITLLIAGDGPERANLERCAQQLGVEERVKFLGRIAHEKLPEIYNAADCLVLASSREGWPNILLEAMACGTPCAATNIWGSGEVITAPEAGRLAPERNAASLTQAIQDSLKNCTDRTAIRTYAEKFSWAQTAENMDQLFTKLTQKYRTQISMPCRPAVQTKKRQRPAIIVTIDTEEKFDWTKHESNAFEVCDTNDIEQFQAICDSASIKPHYFLSYPIIDTAASGNYYNQLHKQDRASLGLHLHQWVTPPDSAMTSTFYSFQKNLPDNLHLEKLRTLAKRFEEQFGFNANTHRAGRYGIGLENYKLLSQIGVEFDFSPSAGFDFSNEGGPDFSTMNNKPFTIGISDNKEEITVIPLCGARALQRTRIFYPAGHNLGFSKPDLKKANPIHTLGGKFVPNIPVRLSPEGANISDMIALARFFIKQDIPTLTFSVHSTSFTPGATSYSPDEASTQNLLNKCEQFFNKFRKELDGEFLTMDNLCASYKN